MLTSYFSGGNDRNTFRLNETTGELFLNGELDHERQSLYSLTVEAQDSAKLAARGADLRCRCHDPSLVLINIYVLDKNDFPPKFDKDIFTACELWYFISRNFELSTGLLN